MTNADIYVTCSRQTSYMYCKVPQSAQQWMYAWQKEEDVFVWFKMFAYLISIFTASSMEEILQAWIVICGSSNFETGRL